MIFLFTDFGAQDIYVGQVKAAILAAAPAAQMIDLLHAAPNFDILSSAHLLAAMSNHLPAGSITLAVVDPGVGGTRRPVVMQADERWYVGPDNGLLAVVAARAARCRVWEIVWRPQVLSATFHGRDLFAPICAMLENGEWWADALVVHKQLQVQCETEDLRQVIYVDHYGNAMTGLRATEVDSSVMLEADGHAVAYVPTFSAAPQGMPFWYVNSIGLVEISVNCGNAAAQLGLSPGSVVLIAG